MNRFDVVGHKTILDELYRIAHTCSGAFLFYGPPSSGKRTVAFEFSRHILCLGGEESCASCRIFPDHPDFLCVGRLDSIKVADIDLILELHGRAPFLSKRRVFVLDNVEYMTYEASNRLLKILEEPLLNCCFILVTIDPSLLLPTIVSRCLRYKFNNLSSNDLKRVLVERIGIPPESVGFLSRLCSGATIDIFSRIGLYTDFRSLVLDLFSRIREIGVIGILDGINRVPEENIDILVDVMTCLLGDMIAVKNGAVNIINTDVIGKIENGIKDLNLSGLILALSLVSQVKRYSGLNINIGSHLKMALMKAYPYLIKV